MTTVTRRRRLQCDLVMAGTGQAVALAPHRSAHGVGPGHGGANGPGAGPGTGQDQAEAAVAAEHGGRPEPGLEARGETVASRRPDWGAITSASQVYSRKSLTTTPSTSAGSCTTMRTDRTRGPTTGRRPCRTWTDGGRWTAAAEWGTGTPWPGVWDRGIFKYFYPDHLCRHQPSEINDIILE